MGFCGIKVLKINHPHNYMVPTWYFGKKENIGHVASGLQATASRRVHNLPFPCHAQK